MKPIALLTVAAMGMAFSQSAFAADFGVRPAYTPPAFVAPTWTGFYLGFNAGWGWSNTNDNDLVFSPTVPPRGLGTFAPFVIGSGANSVTGPVYGGQLGYNYQTGNWVVGIEVMSTAPISAILTILRLWPFRSPALGYSAAASSL